jgi:hypothetical protein
MEGRVSSRWQGSRGFKAIWAIGSFGILGGHDFFFLHMLWASVDLALADELLYSIYIMGSL